MKKICGIMLAAVLVLTSLTGCGTDSSQGETTQEEARTAAIEDGVYSAEFHTDSSMFHVNEANDDRGTLTVKDGLMTIHVSLASKNIVNLFPGTAEEAQKEGADLLEPTVDRVTYSDGMTDEVYGFDIPVPALDEEFDVALIGTRGNWYDHKVSVSNPEKTGDMANGEESLQDGTYTPTDFTWSGGSGRVKISCDEITVEDGQPGATIEFDSPYYTTVRVGDTSYDGTCTEDTSTFHIPVVLNEANTIYGTTTRMSTAHEIKYSITPCLTMDDNTEDDTDATDAPDDEKGDSEEGSETSTLVGISHEPPDIEDLTYEKKLDLSYAVGFDVFYYKDGYAVINVYDSCQYLLVPEGMPVPENLSDSIKILQQPVDHIYMAATSAMALFRAMDALDTIRLTGTDASGWYVQEAADALEKGDMLFAGKYSEPDYELLVEKGCKLAVESTMILHSPKVQEMIENLGIPVFIDRSSYEEHPLGRTEWIKLYGVLVDKEEEAEAFFDEQAQVIRQLADFKNTEKTVAFFYIDTNQTVVVRSSDDYIPQMIEIAGGRYIFDDLNNEESNSASVSLSMEEFYATAMDADYLIYNGTIDNPLGSVEDLLEKSELFADFKAVKEGNVWTVGKDLYQATDIVGQMIGDINRMLTDGSQDDMIFLNKVE